MIANVADVHVGNHRRLGGPVESGLNRRCRQVIAALRRAYDEACTRGATRFVVEGDLFDTTRPEAQVIAAVQEALAGPCPVRLLLGNHDMVSVADGDNALGPLAALDNVRVVEQPWVEAAQAGDESVELVYVPFRPGPAPEWLPPALTELLGSAPAERPRVLFLHLGISEAGSTPSFLMGAEDSIGVAALSELCAAHSVGQVYAGNWHSYKAWARQAANIVQVGTLAPTGWDNPGLEGYGGLSLFRRQGGRSFHERVEIPGPRFLSVGTNEQDQLGRGEVLEALRAQGHSVYFRWRCSPAELPEVQAAAEALKPSVEGYEVEAVDPEAEGAARAAAEAARGQGAVEDALAVFVEKMPLPAGVDRAQVLAESRKFLKLEAA